MSCAAGRGEAGSVEMLINTTPFFAHQANLAGIRQGWGRVADDPVFGPPEPRHGPRPGLGKYRRHTQDAQNAAVLS